jgi:hypothetical protein
VLNIFFSKKPYRALFDVFIARSVSIGPSHPTSHTHHHHHMCVSTGETDQWKWSAQFIRYFVRAFSRTNNTIDWRFKWRLG